MSPMKFLQVTYSESTPNQGIKGEQNEWANRRISFLTS